MTGDFSHSQSWKSWEVDSEYEWVTCPELTVFLSLARNQGFDVVLVDTAGRMQDNAPLMTALAKLITVNTPDLVLFVGEALVGNEAVDQLVRGFGLGSLYN